MTEAECSAQLSKICWEAVRVATRGRVSEADLDDMAQTVALKYLPKAHTVNDATRQAYIGRIAVNEHRRWLRKRKTTPTSLGEIHEIEDRSEERTDDYYARTRLESVLEEMEAEIEAKYPRGFVPLHVFRHFRDSGWNCAATAARIGKDPGYVYVNLHRYREVSVALERMKGLPEGWHNGATWESADDIIAGYRVLLNAVGFHTTVSHVKIRTANAWARYASGQCNLNSAAIWSCALAKFFQQCGHYQEATAALEDIKRAGPLHSILRRLDGNLADSLQAIRLRLAQREYGRPGCQDDLRNATASLRKSGNQAKFRWRINLDAIVRGDYNTMGVGLEDYLASTNGGLIPRANVEMLHCLSSLKQNKYQEAMAHANSYREFQQKVWQLSGRVPDLSIQGVITGLSLQTKVHLLSPSCRKENRNELALFLLDLHDYQRLAGVAGLADGLQEIACLLDSEVFGAEGVSPVSELIAKSSKGRRKSKSPGNKRDLAKMCARLDQIILA